MAPYYHNRALRPLSKYLVNSAITYFDMPSSVEQCWATGGTLDFQEGNHSFSRGVHNTVVQTERTKYGSENDELMVQVYQFANCRQTVHGPGRTKVVVIPSLRDAYAEIYRQAIEAFVVGREEMEKRGDARAAKMAWADFRLMAFIAKRMDAARGFDNDMSGARMLELVRAQHAICSITGVVMTSMSTNGDVRGPFDVCMDSMVSKGHVAADVELKIRLLRGVHNITRKDFLRLFLNQVLVPVPEAVRQLASAEYDAMPCSARDAWNHSVVEP